MSHLPSVELLESTHDFPCVYTLKVIGHSRDGFVARIVSAVRETVGGDTDPPFRVRQTSGGRHVSVTLEPSMESAWQVLAVYGRIHEIEGVVLVF